MNIANKAGKAGILLLLKKGWSALVSFIVLAFLARTLNKVDFGIVAISATLIQLIQIFATSGISEFIVFYNKNNQKEINNAAFWLNLFFAIIISIIILIVAPFWASFYNNNRIQNIVYLLVFSFFFNSLSVIPKGIFQKKINYKPIVFTQTIFGTIANILKVIFAFFGFGVYSLAMPSAIIAPFVAIILYKQSNFIPKKYFGIKYWKQIFNYTKYVIGQRVFNKLVNEGDTLIIGKLFGLEVLGIYNIAFQLSHLFTSQFLPLITNISIPVLSKNNNNLEIVSIHYYKMIRLITFISIPILTISIIMSDFLITLIYGQKWIDAILVFQIMSVAVIFKSISSPTSGLFFVMGKPKEAFIITLIFSLFFLTTLITSSLLNNFILTVVLISLVRVLGSIFSVKYALKTIGKSMLFISDLIFQLLLVSLLFIFIKFYFKYNNYWVLTLNVLLYLAILLILFSSIQSENLRGVIEDLKKIKLKRKL